MNVVTIYIGLAEEPQRIIAGFTVLILWLLSLIPVFPRFVKTVPTEYTAHVTNDLLSGTLRIYGPGSYLIYPWEQTRAPNIISLERVTMELRGVFPTRIGGAVELIGSVRYYPTLNGAVQYIGIDETTIRNGFRDIFLHEIHEVVSQLTPDEILANIKLIQRSVIEDFENDAGKKGVLEDTFGVRFEGLNFVLKPDAATEQARRIEYEYEKRQRAVQAFENADPHAVEAFLIDQGRVSKSITEIRGFEELGAAAGAIAALLTGGTSKLAKHIVKEIADTQKGKNV